MTTLDQLTEAWQEAKRAESEAKARRQAIEDDIVKLAEVDTSREGTWRVGDLKAVSRHSVTIDSQKLQDIAREKGLSDSLGTLFTWKPSINKKLWDATDETITAPLSDAITRKPGRPTFSIKQQKKEQ